MAKFYPLIVTAVEKNTRNSVVISLSPRTEDIDKFSFTQGQYLTFKRDFDGTELRRSYSICAGRGAEILRVGIKKQLGGAFSTWANDNLKVGDELQAMLPNGNFHAPINADEKRHYLGFAAGSGITPLISLIYTVLQEEPLSTFTLVYGNSSANVIMFREELDDMKNHYMERISVLHILGSERELDLFSGRLDSKKCMQLFSKWLDVSTADLAFICGPEPMMHAVSDSLQVAGMAKENIKYELFGAFQKGRAKKMAANPKKEDDGKRITATIIVDGVTRDVDMPKSGQSILDAAIEAGLGAPFSCKAGVCSTCKARVVEGETEMIANYALEDYEVERGYVLACQCFPLSDKVTVDFDQ